ncbi:hypothetical protein SDC9_90142 [bioreactor metagenome]|uniref:Uncharacterized protein n=1 Tax=bioreactor metagenome TaxID=1076179 RepID=A0A644ZSU1_9ZZZZ
MPQPGTRQGDRGDADLRGPQAVLQVVPLDEDRQGEPQFGDHRDRHDLHPPAVVVDIETAVQHRAAPQVRCPQIDPTLGVFERAPQPAPLVDALTERVSDRLVVEVEHLAADDRAVAAEAGELGQSFDALGFDGDIVVQHHVELGLIRLDGLVHAAGEAARATHVALVDHPQAVTQQRGGLGEQFIVLDVLVALIDDVHPLDDVFQVVGGGQRHQGASAVVGPVEGGDADAQRDRTHRFCVDLPVTRYQSGALLAGDQIEPVPATIGERVQRQDEADLIDPGLGALTVDTLGAALGVRLVHHDVRGAFDVDDEPYLRGDGPLTPIAGRECVEDRGQRETQAGRQGAGAAVLSDQITAVEFGASAHFDIELGATAPGGVGGLNRCSPPEVHVERQGVLLTRRGEDDAGDLRPRRRGCCGFGAHASTPPLFTGSPSLKCGLKTVS